MRPYSSFNRDHNYILTIIDASKYAWVVSLKSKKLLKKHNVNHYSTYMVKAYRSIVERFNRTFKNDMWKMFMLNDTYKWVDALSRLVSDYTARKHRTIGMRFADVTPPIVKRLLDGVQHDKDRKSSKIQSRPFDTREQVQDSFRKRTVYTPNWITEVFKIVKVQHTNPVTYLRIIAEKPSLELYEHELHRATHPDAYLVEKVLRKKGLRQVVGIRWIAQFVDKQKQ
ncbi:uncharacterized protein LOC105423319, partial [Pogonomyrmex barbatus]|uniref:Uncharacterized protein LOC105423319 n=1 Tax=Pogonomyrmex barbatus TaxID=144034 RepID=A0A6I9VR62_9HYME